MNHINTTWFTSTTKVGAQRGALIPKDTRNEMAEKLSRTCAKRGGNRTVMTKLMNEADGLLKAEPSDKKRLKAIATSLNEKLNLIKTLDEQK